MLVYCDVVDCKHNDHMSHMCKNKWPVGTEAVKISENYLGIPRCTDYEYDGEDDYAEEV